MKRLCIVLVILSLSLSGCDWLLFSATGNARRGQTHNEFEKEQAAKEEEAQRHERWQQDRED